MLFLTIIIACFYSGNKNFSTYNDNWILGNNYDAIVEKYGEFDVVHGNIGVDNNVECGYLLHRQYFLNDDEVFYYILFDNEKIAKDVYIRKRAGG